MQEVLFGQNATAVGRTSKIWGSLTIAGSTVTKGMFTVDMASVVSDQSQRNARFDGPIMDVSQFPTATLTLSSPVDLGTIPARRGRGRHYNAVGDLDMHGVTKSVSFPVSAERIGYEHRRVGRYPDPLLRVEHRQSEHRRLRHDGEQRHPRGAAPPHPGAREPGFDVVRTAGSVGGGGPVTVPSTTVPPLSVPSG